MRQTRTYYLSVILLSPLLLLAFCNGIWVGDQQLNDTAYALLHERMLCWSSKEGNWTKSSSNNTTLINKIFSNDDALVTKIYSACGPLARRVGLDYEWTPPSSCLPIHAFSQEKMCKVMRGRTLVFIGDSLSLHTYETMLNALGRRTSYGFGRSVLGCPRKLCPKDTISELLFSRQHYDFCQVEHALPVFDVVSIKCRAAGNFAFIRTELLNLYKQNMLVIVANWGTAYTPDDKLREHITDILSWVNARLPGSLFIFRASNMAHPNCDVYSHPDNVMHEPTDHDEFKHWGWAKFPKQNELWKAALARTSAANLFLDVFPLSSKNPSQHPGKGDCLHYCLPGPIDTWVKLVFSTLFEIENLAVYTKSIDTVFRNNTLLRCNGKKQVYMLMNGRKRLIPDIATFMSMKLDFEQVIDVSGEACSRVAEGEAIVYS